jgi:hypothetical protein
MKQRRVSFVCSALGPSDEERKSDLCGGHFP